MNDINRIDDFNYRLNGGAVRADEMGAVYRVTDKMILEVTLRDDSITIDFYPEDARTNGEPVMSRGMMAHEWADFLFDGEPGSDTALRECDECQRREYAHLAPDWEKGVCNFCLEDDEEGV